MPPAGPVFPKSDPGSRPRFIQFIDLIDSQINASSEVVNRKSEKKQHRLINKKKTQNNWFLRIQLPWEVFSAESQFCQSSVWLYRAFSPGNIRLPPALSGGTTLRRAVKTWRLSYDIVMFFPNFLKLHWEMEKLQPWKAESAWGAARAARLFIMPRDPPSAKCGAVARMFLNSEGRLIQFSTELFKQQPPAKIQEYNVQHDWYR